MASRPVRPDALVRALSEIDLNTVRRRYNSDARPIQEGFHYSQDQLLSIRPEHPDQVDGAALSDLSTPPGPPTVPPATPAELHSAPQSPVTVTADNKDDDEPEGLELDRPEPKPKKKTTKRGGKSRKAAPTGFEEFYADPPITPDEHLEETDLYSSSRSFSDRIQTCIQRYRAKRKLDEVRANILTKYLMLGGVDATPSKQFTGGLDKDTLESSTAQEIAAIQATDYIRTGTKNAKFYDPADPEGWVVDFTGVAKGFFSYRVPHVIGIDTEQDVKTFCAVIKNFLNYVLKHGVCPEYTQDLICARTVCDMAEKELWAVRRVQQLLPGDYNAAASTLYGGRGHGCFEANKGWADDDAVFEGSTTYNPGFSAMEAERVFKTAIAFAGNDELFLKALKGDIHVVKKEKKCFELIEIERADMRTIGEFAGAKNHNGIAGAILPLGVVKFQPWEGLSFEPEDMTDDEDASSTATGVEPVIESFWLEDEVLQHCFVGMKLEVVVYELNVGVKYFDLVDGPYCSFHTYLPNEKMTNWKDPASNTRPAPTEDDPDAEEAVMGAMMEREIE